MTTLEKKRRNLTVAIDESNSSQIALKWTLENLVKQNDLLTVISVASTESYIGVKAHEELSEEPGENESKDVQTARGVLFRAQEMIKEYSDKTDKNVSYVIYPIRGTAARDNIVQFCKEHATDTLIVGSHGVTGLRRMILGSTSEYVVRNAPCPVVVVREVDTL